MSFASPTSRSSWSSKLSVTPSQHLHSQASRSQKLSSLRFAWPTSDSLPSQVHVCLLDLWDQDFSCVVLEHSVLIYRFSVHRTSTHRCHLCLCSSSVGRFASSALWARFLARIVYLWFRSAFVAVGLLPPRIAFAFVPRVGIWFGPLLRQSFWSARVSFSFVGAPIRVVFFVPGQRLWTEDAVAGSRADSFLGWLRFQSFDIIGFYPVLAQTWKHHRSARRRFCRSHQVQLRNWIFKACFPWQRVLLFASLGLQRFTQRDWPSPA